MSKASKKVETRDHDTKPYSSAKPLTDEERAQHDKKLAEAKQVFPENGPAHKKDFMPYSTAKPAGHDTWKSASDRTYMWNLIEGIEKEIKLWKLDSDNADRIRSISDSLRATSKEIDKLTLK